MLLSELPHEQNEIAMGIVRTHLRKSSISSEPSSPRVPGSPKLPSPTTPAARTNDFSQEEMHRSLRRTAAEIQNYSYEGIGTKLDRDRDTTSQDSGISQMSVGNDGRNDVRNDVDAELAMRTQALKIGNGPRSLPYSVNGLDAGEPSTNTNGYSNAAPAEDLNESEVVKNVQKFCAIDNPTPTADKQRLLSQLAKIMHKGPTDPTVANFRPLLRLLIDNLDSRDPKVQILVLQVFMEMFKNKDTEKLWSGFTELIILRILQAHSSDKREVRASCAVPFNGFVIAVFF